MHNQLTLLVLLFSFFHGNAQNLSKDKPNIVFILADDLGYGDLGAYGQQIIKTPNLDQLAKEGIQFINFYSGTSVCAPSRSSLMTGQHTGHTNIRGNKEIEPEGQHPLADSVETLAMLLKQAGYTSGAFGKWGLGMVGTSGDPTLKGFDEFFGYNCQRHSHRYYPTHLWHNDEKIILEGNDLTQKVQYAPELIQEKTLEFIDNNKDNPFFLFVPTVLPHAELAGPNDEYFKMYENQFEETPHKGNDYGPNATIAGYSSVEKPRATYASMVSRMDGYVGQILEKLEEYNLTENTIVIFSSDNGAHREGGADPEFFNSAGNLRGFKRDLYEGGIRVPLIVKWPNVTPTAVTSEHIGAFWDIIPTVTEITGAPEANYTDGISFYPTLSNNGDQKKHDHLYWEFHEDGGRQAVRKDNWKLIRLNVRNPEKTSLELYDLQRDPKEKNNLVEKHPKLVKELLQALEAFHTESTVFPLLP